MNPERILIAAEAVGCKMRVNIGVRIVPEPQTAGLPQRNSRLALVDGASGTENGAIIALSRADRAPP